LGCKVIGDADERSYRERDKQINHANSGACADNDNTSPLQ